MKIIIFVFLQKKCVKYFAMSKNLLYYSFYKDCSLNIHICVYSNIWICRYLDTLITWIIIYHCHVCLDCHFTLF